MTHIVSVIVPAFNARATIARTLHSVLQQSSRFNTEVIVVDDGSTDGTAEHVSSYGSPVRVIRLAHNRGAGFARNVGIIESTGAFVAFLDSDDYWHPIKLESQVAAMVRNSWDACCTAGVFISLRKRKAFIKEPMAKYTHADLFVLCSDNRIVTSSMVVRRDVIRRYRFGALRNRQDLVLWATMLKDGVEIFGLPDRHTFYDLDTRGISWNKARMLAANYRAYSQILQNSPLAACSVVCSAFRNLVYRLRSGPGVFSQEMPGWGGGLQVSAHHSQS